MVQEYRSKCREGQSYIGDSHVQRAQAPIGALGLRSVTL